MASSYNNNSRKIKPTLHFCSAKSKLSGIVPDIKIRSKLSSAVLKCHEAFKRGLFFYKAFCLHRESRGLSVPAPSHSVFISCLDQLCERNNRGVQCKSTETLIQMREYGKEVFSTIYPEKLDMKGLSMMKSLVVEQMLSTVLTEVTTRFRSRCIKLCISLGAKNKREASNIVHSAFLGEWEEVVNPYSDSLKRILPQSPAKNNITYDLKANPSKYLEATLRLCRELGAEDCKFSFCPTRSSCIPCHCKMDTESLAQLILPRKECVKARNDFGKDGRKEYNDWVWNKVVRRKKIDSKFKTFSFHHEISTDGVSVSLLYSREVKAEPRAKMGDVPEKTSIEAPDTSVHTRTHVGVDPGKRNLVTMIDAEGTVLRYTCRQRMFESKHTRYQAIMKKEKRLASGVLEAEQDLSKHFRKTNDHSEFLSYLTEKKMHDDETHKFYIEEKWRGWKFRLFCNRKRSEDQGRRDVQRRLYSPLWRLVTQRPDEGLCSLSRCGDEKNVV